MIFYTDLEMDFMKRAVVRGGIIMLLPKVAIDLINECEKQSIKISGIDGFYLTSESTQPSMEDSMDLSAYIENNNFREVYEIARNFILARIEKGLYFEVVIHAANRSA